MIFPRDGELPQPVQCTQCNLCAPLSALTHQAANYKPSKEHFENFNRIKVEFSNMGALPYFEQPSRGMLPRMDLVHVLYRRGKWFVMLPEP